MKHHKPIKRLKSGFGSIQFLGANRSNPYAVYAPSSITDKKGKYRYNKPLAYTKTWQDGFCILLAYHNGTYTHDMNISRDISGQVTDAIADKIMRAFSSNSPSSEDKEATFKEVYELFFDDKFHQEHRTYSPSTIEGIKAAYKYFSPLHNRPVKHIKYQELQSIIDNAKLSYSAKNGLLKLIKPMFRYALAFEYIEKDFAKLVRIKSKNDTVHGKPYTLEELRHIYKHIDHPKAKSLLVMCLTGFRINEYKSLAIDLENNTLIGGSKTEAGKNRIVPIHPFIKPYIIELMNDRSGILKTRDSNRFRLELYTFLEAVGIAKHKPHDTRHTFSYICDKFEVDQIQKKRMLGHSFQDITNAVYGHTDYDILFKEISKIPMNFLNC